MEPPTKWGLNYDLIWPVQIVHKQLVWRTKMYTQCMPYPTSAASHLKCLLPLFISAYICMCCFYFSAAYVLMCFHIIYVLLCFVLFFYIWFWIAFRIIAGGKTSSPSSEYWFNPGMARNVTVQHAFSSAFSFLLHMIFALFLLFYVLIFFGITFWFILMFFHHWLFLAYFCFFYCYWIAVGVCRQLYIEALGTLIAVCDCQ
jgi:hypothetical protein